MTRLRANRRIQFFALALVVPVLLIAALGIYLANMVRALPWQEEPTPIAANVTPFAALSSPMSDRATPSDTPSASPAPAGGATYAILPEESEARYVVKETVGRLSLPTEAVGRTRAIRGQFVLDADGRPLTGSEFQVDLRTLQSGEGQRDNFIQTVTLKDAPLADFTITGVEDWTGPLLDGQERTFTLVGEMTINGVTAPTIFETTATRTGDVVTGTAHTTFTWADFNLTPPNVAAQLISVEETARIEIEITASAA